MCVPGPWLGTSSYWKAVILRLMSVWGMASTKRAPCARLKQRTVSRAWSFSASSSVRSPARSRYTWEPWTPRTRSARMSSIHLTHHTAVVTFWTFISYAWRHNVPGSACGVWCTHGDLPCVQMRALCSAAGWQWWLLWGRATPGTPESSVGRSAPHLDGETRGSNRCGWQGRLHFCNIFNNRRASLLSGDLDRVPKTVEQPAIRKLGSRIFRALKYVPV